MDIRVVILQRGWVAVGLYSEEGGHCLLRPGAIVREWGTKHGLGELCANGPTADTVLDPFREWRSHELTVVGDMRCEAAKWMELVNAWAVRFASSPP